jgi:hypothetical protein
MPPSITVLTQPIHFYDVLFQICTYLLPMGLAFSWTALALLDMAEKKFADGIAWAAGVLVLPLLGSGAYLLIRATGFSRAGRLAIVCGGLALWLIALATGLPHVWGPLGPKAL